MKSEAQNRYPLHNTRIAVPSEDTETRTATTRPSVRGDGSPPPMQTGIALTLVVLVPRFYNPDRQGFRKPVEPEKLVETEREMLDYFSGYQKFLIEGGYRDPGTGEEFYDALIRFEIDAECESGNRAFLNAWKQTLEERFQQRCIYMKLVGPVVWT
jgi:hypothetical protein